MPKPKPAPLPPVKVIIREGPPSLAQAAAWCRVWSFLLAQKGNSPDRGHFR